MSDPKAKKQAYFGKLISLLEEYNKVLLVSATNVGSNQIQNIRKVLRGKGVVLFGKNTLIRKIIRGQLAKNPKLEELLPYVRGNIGFIFTNGDLAAIKKTVEDLKVDAPAKVDAIAPKTVIIPAGPTGLEPGQTSFLQALNIQSKINKGQVEIVNDVTLITEGEKVGPSEVALLAKLNLKPFSYGLVATTVYDDGTIYDAKVLDLSEKDILEKFSFGVSNVTAVGLALSFPTSSAVPHLVLNGFKNVLAIAFGTEFTFERAEKIKARAAAAPVAAAPAAKAAAPAAAKAAEPEPEPEEEEGDMGFGLFD